MSTAAASTVVCSACLDEHSKASTVGLSCKCRYCVECLEEMVKLAISADGMACHYRPRCCSGLIPLKKLQRVSKQLLQEYRSKLVEIVTDKRTYCSNASCKRFIPFYSIHNGDGHCRACQSVTCARCKEASHFGSCRQSTSLEEMAALMEANKWQRCPGCQQIVERSEGCRHMSCRCGTHFCYICGTRMKEDSRAFACDCEDDYMYDEDAYDEDDDVHAARGEWGDIRDNHDYAEARAERAAVLAARIAAHVEEHQEFESATEPELIGWTACEECRGEVDTRDVLYCKECGLMVCDPCMTARGGRIVGVIGADVWRNPDWDDEWENH